MVKPKQKTVNLYLRKDLPAPSDPYSIQSGRLKGIRVPSTSTGMEVVSSIRPVLVIRPVSKAISGSMMGLAQQRHTLTPGEYPQ